jgi:hypothetical protein
VTRAESSGRRPSKITIPERCNPLAKLVFGEMARQGVTYDSLEWSSGVLCSTIKAWRTDNNPGLLSIEAALGALGWALIPVPQHDLLPEFIRNGIAALNEQWRRDEPLLHHLLASACLAPILVKHAGESVVTATITPRKKKAPNPFQASIFGEVA